MTFDPGLADRCQTWFQDHTQITEKQMFGGIGYFFRGNMACGVYKDYLIVRVGAEAYESALARPHVTVFDVTGRAMKGWVMVDPEGVAEDEDLSHWLHAGLAFTTTLPPK